MKFATLVQTPKAGAVWRERRGGAEEVQRDAGRREPARPTRSQHQGKDEDNCPQACRHIHHDAHLHKAAHRVSLMVLPVATGRLNIPLHFLRALAGAAGCLPRIGFRRRLSAPARPIRGCRHPAGAGMHHLQRLDGPQRALSTPDPSIARTAPTFGGICQPLGEVMHSGGGVTVVRMGESASGKRADDVQHTM